MGNTIPTIDKQATTRWAVAYRGQLGAGVQRYWFELMNTATNRAHSLIWTGVQGGTSVGSAGFPFSSLDCPNYFGFKTVNPAKFSDFDGAGATLTLKSALLYTWINLYPTLPISPKTRGGTEDVTAKMKDWGLSLPGVSGAIGLLSVDYGSGVPTCPKQSIAKLEWDISEEPEIPIRITQKENRFCISVPGDVLFDFDKDSIKENIKAKSPKDMTPGQRALYHMALVIRASPSRRVSIVGHTDSIDTDEYNLDLSQRRANSVARWLTDPNKGQVTAKDMIVKGVGEANPVVDNSNDADTEANRKAQAPNRRVDICLIPR